MAIGGQQGSSRRKAGIVLVLVLDHGSFEDEDRFAEDEDDFEPDSLQPKPINTLLSEPPRRRGENMRQPCLSLL